MTVELFALWALVGWCGTPPRPWPWPHPEPDPWPWLVKLVGVAGGIIGGLVYNQAWAAEGAVTAVGAAATCVGAFVGAGVLGNVYSLIRGRK